MKHSRLLLPVVLFALCWASLARAESVIATPSPARLDPAGGELALEVQVLYQNAPAAMGLELGLPEGWTFAGVAGEQAPGITSRRGTTGKVECAWTTAPAGGVTFKLKLSYPAGVSATTLLGNAQLRRDGKRLDLALSVPLSQ